MTIVGGTEVQVRPNTDSFADDMKSKIGSALKNPLVVAGAAVTAAGATVAAFAKSSVDKFQEVGGQVSQLTRLTGGTTESMSHLRFAAQETGVSTDSLGNGIKKLSQNISKNGDDFAKLGIKINDAHGKTLPMDQILGNVSEKFAKMPNGIEKNTLAIQLFGRGGTDLLPILNKGKAGLADLSAEADRFGLTLTQKNLDAIKQNAAAHREFQAAVDGLKVQIGANLLPVMAEFAEFLNSKAVPAIAAITGYVNDTMAPKFGELTTAVKGAYTAFTDGFSDGSAVQTNLGSIGTIFSGFGAAVKGIFDDAVIAYNSFADGFKDSDAVGAEVGPLATTFAALGTAVKTTLDVLKAIAEELAKHPAIVKAAAEAVAGFFAAYKAYQFGKRTIDLVVTGVETAKKAIGSVADALTKIAGDKIVNVKTVESIAGNAGTGAAKGAGNAAGQAGGSFVADQAGGVVSGAAGGALGNFFDLKELGPKIKGFAKGAVELLGIALLTSVEALGGIASAIAAVVFSPVFLVAAAVAAIAVVTFVFRDEIFGFLGKIPGWVGEGLAGLQSFGQYLLGKGEELLQGLLDGAIAGFIAVGQFFIDLPNMIAYAIGFVLGTLFAIGRDLLAGLLAGVVFAYEAVKAFFLALPGAVLALLDLVGTLIQKGRDIIDGLKNGIVAAFVAVSTFFVDLAGAVIGFVGDVASTLFNKGKDLLQGLKRGIDEFWKDPIGFFKSLPSNVVNAVGDVIRTLYDKGRDIVTGLKNGVENLYDSAISKFRDLKGNVTGAISGAADWLYNAGKDIVQGIINGINSLFDKAIEKLKSLGTSMIKGFKDAAGIKSPSVLMHESGVLLLQGLANGISAGKQMAVDAMDDVSSSLLDPFGSRSVALPGIGAARANGKYTHIGQLTIQNTKTLQENLDEIDRLSPLVGA